MHLSHSPVKVLLTEKSCPSLKVLGKGASPPCSPKWDPYVNRCPFPVLFNISFRVPSRGALPPGSPHRAPTKRDAPFPELSSSLSKSLVN